MTLKFDYGQDQIKWSLVECEEQKEHFIYMNSYRLLYDIVEGEN